MKLRGYLYRAALFGLLIVGIPGAANALVSWTFNSGNCVATVGPAGNCGSGNNNFSDGRTYQGMGGAGNVTVSGWANTISNNTQLELGQITHYGGGLGVRNADAPAPAGRAGDNGEGTTPEHAVDNDQRFDLVLFDFGDQVVDLSEIEVGWFRNDADISVLAYRGDLNPTDSAGSHYIGNRKAFGSDEDLTSHGWELVGNYDVDSQSDDTAIVNPDDKHSSYWLVSAYNPIFGSSCAPTNKCGSSYKDYFKILTLAGDIVPPTGNSVPAPPTALLLAAGMLAFGRMSSGRG